MEGKNWLIVGKTGTGKSYFARYIVKRSDKPYKVVVDISNDYMRDREIRRKFYNVRIGRHNAGKVYDWYKLITKYKNVHIEVEDLTDEEIVYFMDNLADFLPNNSLLVIDEAHQFFPRYKYSVGLERLLRIARKYNIDIVLVTQMIVDLNLVALKQATLLVVFQLTEQNELKKLANYIENAEEVLPKLKRGEKLIKNLRTGEVHFEGRI